MKDCSKKWWHKTRKKKAHDQGDKRSHTEERRGPKMIMCNRPREKKKKNWSRNICSPEGSGEKGCGDN